MSSYYGIVALSLTGSPVVVSTEHITTGDRDTMQTGHKLSYDANTAVADPIYILQ